MNVGHVVILVIAAVILFALYGYLEYSRYLKRHESSDPFGLIYHDLAISLASVIVIAVVLSCLYLLLFPV